MVERYLVATLFSTANAWDLQAVEFAVNRGFDIISLSWTVQRSDDPKNSNAADVARLQAAVGACGEGQGSNLLLGSRYRDIQRSDPVLVLPVRLCIDFEQHFQDRRG